MEKQPFIDEIRSNANIFMSLYSYVSAQMCAEALNFIVDVETFRESVHCIRTVKEIEIVNRYVKVGATEPINITMGVKEKIYLGLGKGEQNLFDEAQLICIKLLQGEIWYDYKRTEEYKRSQEAKPLKAEKGKIEKSIQKVVPDHMYISTLSFLYGKKKFDELNSAKEDEGDKTVVILGAGIVGVLVAKSLYQIYKKKINIIVVDRKSYFYMPDNCISLFFDVSEKDFEQRIDQLQIPYADIFNSHNGIVFMQNEILKVMPQKVLLSNTCLYYDALVICTGSSYNAPQSSMVVPLTWTSLHSSEVHRLIDAANSIMIAGGGVVGVNAALLACESNKEISLTYTTKEPIVGLHSDAEDKIRKTLRSKQNIFIFPNTQVELTPQPKKPGKFSIQLLSSEDSKNKNKKDHVKHTLSESPLFSSFCPDLILWCDSHLPNSSFMVRHFPNSINEDKYIKVNPHLQVLDSGLSNIFAGGDGVAWKNGPDLKEITTAAHHAKMISNNIRALFMGKPMKTYKPTMDKQRFVNLGYMGTLVVENGRITAESDSALKIKGSFINEISDLIFDSPKPIHEGPLIKNPSALKIVIIVDTIVTISLTEFCMKSDFDDLTLVIQDLQIKKKFEKEEKIKIVDELTENLLEGTDLIVMSPFMNQNASGIYKKYLQIIKLTSLKYIVSIHPYGMGANIGLSPVSTLITELEEEIKQSEKSYIIIRYGVIIDFLLSAFSQSLRDRSVWFPSFACTWPSKQDIFEAIVEIIKLPEEHKNTEISLTGGKRLHITTVMNMASTSIGEQINHTSLSKNTEWLEMLVKAGIDEAEAELTYKWFYEDASKFDKPNESIYMILKREPIPLDVWFEKNGRIFF